MILSLPTLTWADLQTAKAPTLARLLKERPLPISRLARIASRRASGPAYVTIGSGTRAAGDDLAGDEGFEPGERFGTQTAGSIYRQRTGRAPGRGLVDLGIPRVKGANNGLLYGAQPGALGDTLAKAGYSRAVIANADWFDPDSSPPDAVQYSRPAVGALMGADGRVPGGKVGPELLMHDARSVRPATGSFGGRACVHCGMEAALRRAGRDLRSVAHRAHRAVRVGDAEVDSAGACDRME